MRFEKKFVVNENFNGDIKNFLLQNKFSIPYPSRVVNSIYYDSNCFRRYFESEDGISERSKARIRFYDEDTKKLMLEYKIKNSELGWKRYLHINSSELRHKSKTINLRNANYRRFEVTIPKTIENIESPSLYVSYKRNYYVSEDRRVRITLDNGLLFCKLRNGHFINKESNNISSGLSVLEAKYDYDVGDLQIIEQLTAIYSLNLSRFSKYCLGIDVCY